jgi:hypothetical protein
MSASRPASPKPRWRTGCSIQRYDAAASPRTSTTWAATFSGDSGCSPGAVAVNTITGQWMR